MTAQGTQLDNNQPITIRADFLVGCDGGRSPIRRAIGATLSGTAEVQRVQSTYIRAPSLLAQERLKPAWMTFSLNPAAPATSMRSTAARHGWSTTISSRMNTNSSRSIATGRSAPSSASAHDFEYEILSKEDWIGRRLVADQFRDGRVFICGDAAHLWMPDAGYGMNAGIADATNLAWLLAAHL